MKACFIIVAALMLSACSKPTPKEQLSATIEQMKTAIDNGDKRLLLDKFLANEDITEHNLKDRELKRFKQALEKANTASAVVRMTATISTEAENRDLTFAKYGDQWKFVK